MQSNSSTFFGLLSTARYSNSVDLMRARVTMAFALFAATTSVIISLVTLAFVHDPKFATPVVLGTIFTGLLPQIAVVALVRSGYLRVGIALTYIPLIASAGIALYDGLAANTMLIMALPMLFAGLVWEVR